MKSTDLTNTLYTKPGHLIRRLQQISVAVFLEETKGHDITPVQFAALAAINAHPGVDQLRLANAIGFDRTTIAGVVERLEVKGLITRKTDASDRRAKVLYISAAGEKLLGQVYPANERVQERILEGLREEERPLFIDMLTRLAHVNNEVSRVPITLPLPKGQKG